MLQYSPTFSRVRYSKSGFPKGPHSRGIRFCAIRDSGSCAIALGGSYARGTAGPDSDLDVGVYHSEQSKPDVENIRRCIEKLSARSS
jgi:predicted nucleotidyltransferase